MANYNLDFMDKDAMYKAIDEAVAYIKKNTTHQPTVGIVLGSGLGEFVARFEDATEIPFSDIPNFPIPTVEGHGGKLVLGKVEGKTVVAMQGRYHYYEGYDTQTITFPIRVLGELGIETIILTNACGGVNESFKPGDLMLITDHLSMFCPTGLRGAHLDKFGPRFTDMSETYHPAHRELLEACAKKLDIPIQKGVYGYWTGPTYETAAEVLAYKALGADVVGMSTVGEAAVAVNHGLKVLGVSAITNMTCAVSKEKTTHQDVVAMGAKISSKFIALLSEFIKEV